MRHAIKALVEILTYKIMAGLIPVTQRNKYELQKRVTDNDY